MRPTMLLHGNIKAHVNKSEIEQGKIKKDEFLEKKKKLFNSLIGQKKNQ